jgi:poly(hydroxyalkanoate) depolymerase family esterase
MPVLNGRARRRLVVVAAAAAAALWVVVPDTAVAATQPDPSSYTSCVDNYISDLASPTGLATYLSCLEGISSTTPGTGGSPPPGTLPGQLTTGSSGGLSYELYVPSTYTAGTKLPLVVALHGCTMTADSMRLLTGWDTEAQNKGFIVLFPQQSSSRNSLSCWNWFQSADDQRGAGEAAIIDGMVNMVEGKYSVNTKQVYAAGLSAGGAMANVMGATYPDVFAAVGSGSGCEYGASGLPCIGSPGSDPSVVGPQVHSAEGSFARMVPAIVFQGTSDTTVDPRNGDYIARMWVTADQLMDSSISSTPTTTSGSGYTITSYGGHLVDYWSIQGMGHAWSGGNSSQQYSYPSGPNETDAMWTFFSNHPHP